MGKLDGKVAVITGGTSGMALAGAKLFVDQGACCGPAPGRASRARSAASKAVLPAYAGVWVSELRDRKVRVNVLTPGQVATPILEAVMDAEMKAQFESVIPRRAMGRPEEIASVALSSPRTTPATSMAWSWWSTAAPP